MTIKEKELSKEINRLRSKITSRDKKIVELKGLHQDMFKNFLEVQNENVFLREKISKLELDHEVL